MMRGSRVGELELEEIVESLVDPRGDTAVAQGNVDPVGHLETILLPDFIGDGLLAPRRSRVVGAVPVVEAELLADLDRQLESPVVGVIDHDRPGSVDEELGDLGFGKPALGQR